MLVISGVDACKGGWISVSRDLLSGEISSQVFQSAGNLVCQTPKPLVMAIDIPIGLTDSGPRQCDLLARKMLGQPRGSSVFPAPIRPALKARNYQEANEITKSIDDKGVTKQAWELYTRIKEFDEILSRDPIARRIIYEVHPEVSFMAWNGGTAIVKNKKSDLGKSIRAKLVNEHFGRDAFRIVRDEHRKGLVSDHDINDAFAALWSTERIHNGTFHVIPNPPIIDSKGLQMCMWY